MTDIDTGDHVHHAPSGEDWVVAYVHNGRIAWCGWPCGDALLSDCALLMTADAAERDALLTSMAVIVGGDPRGTYARRRLAEQADKCESE